MLGAVCNGELWASGISGTNVRMQEGRTILNCRKREVTALELHVPTKRRSATNASCLERSDTLPVLR